MWEGVQPSPPPAQLGCKQHRRLLGHRGEDSTVSPTVTTVIMRSVIAPLAGAFSMPGPVFSTGHTPCTVSLQ